MADTMTPKALYQDRTRVDGGQITPDELQRLQKRHGALVLERSTWVTHWADITKKLLPRNGRFIASDRNRTDRSRYNDIYDNTATRALRVLGAGLMAGATSPARPWFRLTTEDPDLAQFYPVRAWLDDVVLRMQRVFARSNIYRTTHQLYEELGGFGTACALLLPDPKRVIHLYPVVCGEYCLQQDFRGQIVVLYREFEKSVGELVHEFGLEACSQHVKDNFTSGNYEAPVTVIQVVDQRRPADRDEDSLLPTSMPWRSLYYEKAAQDGRILRESGYRRFPVLAPRWQVAGGDVYGSSCPGMEALGDIRQLQQEQLRKAQAIDFQTLPPLQIPTSMRDRDTDMFPGGQTYYEPGSLLPFDQNTPAGGIRSAFEVNLELQHLLPDIQDVRQRIDRAFFVDLFLMLANANNDMTAKEVAVRYEEKMLMLGPALGRVNDEQLRPMIDLTFDAMLEAKMLPPPPPELRGVELGVEFVSLLAQAQQMVGVNGYDRLIGNVLQIAPVHAEVLDKINFDRWVDIYGQMLGVDTKLIVDDDSVQKLRAARNAAQAAQAQAQMAEQTSKATRNLAASPTAQPNALQAAMTAANTNAAGPVGVRPGIAGGGGV